MKTRTLILTLVLVGAANVAPGYACVCAQPGAVCAHFWRVPTVFAGTVRAIEPVAERPGMLAIHFAVDRRGRGVDADTIVVESAPQDGVNCGYTFRLGERYVVYAYDGPDGQHITNMCGGTKRAAEAALDLAFLDEVNTGPPRGVRVFGQIRRIENDLVSLFRSRDYGGVSGARVELTGEAASRQATTGSDGTYDFRDLPAGTYTVTVTPPAGLAFAGPPLPRVQHQPSSRTVTLRNRSECAEVSSGPRTDSRISGVLVYADGRPAEDEPIDLIALANARRADKEIPNVSVRTGPDGRFTFAFIAPGQYLVGGNLKDPPPASQFDRRSYHPGVTDPATATVVTIDAGSRIQLTPFRLPDWPLDRRISGVVVWSDGVPAPAAQLTLTGARPEPIPVDASGRFSITLPYGAQFGLSARGIRMVNGRNIGVNSPYRSIGRNDRDGEVTLLLKLPE